MLVCISTRQYCVIDYGNFAAKLGKQLDQWLDDHDAWAGTRDQEFVDSHALETRPLRLWASIDGHWSLFHWNDEVMGTKFKNHFTDWNPSHKHVVIVRGIRYSEGTLANTDIAKWFKEHDLANSGDYSYGPHITETGVLNATGFEFKDARIAMLFKLTFGGTHVQSLI